MEKHSNRFIGPILAAVITFAVMAAIAVFIYERQSSRDKAELDVLNALSTRMTGLSRDAAKNALDPRYTDSNGDLVADAPSDPSKLLDPPTLTFCYVTAEQDAEFKTVFSGVMDAISKATGKPVQYVAYNSTVEKLRAMRDGKLSIAGVNTGSVPLAVCTAGYVPLVADADAAGNFQNHMVIIAPADSPLTSIADLRGHELALTEPSSNSGYRVPLVTMRENGMVPPTDYEIRYSGGQVQSVLGIKNKTFEAASVASDILSREQNIGAISTNDYKTIYTSDQTFPGAPIGCAYNLKPDLVAKIKQALLGYDFKGTPLEKFFASNGRVKFVPVDYKADWAFVRRIDDSIGYQYALPPGSDAPAASQPTP